MSEVVVQPGANKYNRKKKKKNRWNKRQRIRRPPHTNTCSPTLNIFNAHRHRAKLRNLSRHECIFAQITQTEKKKKEKKMTAGKRVENDTSPTHTHKIYPPLTHKAMRRLFSLSSPFSNEAAPQKTWPPSDLSSFWALFHSPDYCRQQTWGAN